MDNKTEDGRPALAIFGTGLIGCSIAEGLRDMVSEIIGVDNNSAHLQEALYRGMIDRSMSAGNAAAYAGIIVIAVPVDATIELLSLVLDRADEKAVVIDAGSIKGAICRSVADHPKRKQFVAAHPMAGLALSGPDASDARLFRNKKVIVCEKENSSDHALLTALDVFKRLGMELVYMAPEVHDMYVARVSHLPQVLAYCLSAINSEKISGDRPAYQFPERVEVKDNKAKNEKSVGAESAVSIASTGYESATRLASSPADMWIPILNHNRSNVTGSLDEMIAGLTDIRDMIRKGDWESLEKIIDKANMSREHFISVYK